MAGHSKWANIQYRKNAQDTKRGKIFTKLLREITLATQQGGGDPGANSRLRSVIDKALDHNLTRDAIDKAIKRGLSVGKVDTANVEELTYEGYGPHGIAVLVKCITDNRNRTASELRAVFKKQGGSLGIEGSVAYLFTKKGQLSYAPGTNEAKLLAAAVTAGADDIVTHDDGSLELLTLPEKFSAVKTALAKVGFEAAHAEVTMLAISQVSSVNEEVAENIVHLVEALEALDDVQDVYTNAAF